MVIFLAYHAKMHHSNEYTYLFCSIVHLRSKFGTPGKRSNGIDSVPSPAVFFVFFHQFCREQSDIFVFHIVLVVQSLKNVKTKWLNKSFGLLPISTMTLITKRHRRTGEMSPFERTGTISHYRRSETIV